MRRRSQRFAVVVMEALVPVLLDFVFRQFEGYREDTELAPPPQDITQPAGHGQHQVGMLDNEGGGEEARALHRDSALDALAFDLAFEHRRSRAPEDEITACSSASYCFKSRASRMRGWWATNDADKTLVKQHLSGRNPPPAGA
jgi:hypothetical protein